MMEFTEWFAKQMELQGYKSKWSNSYRDVPNALSWVESTSIYGDKFLTVFVDKQLTEEIVRTIFEGAHEPVLFVVDRHLIMPLGIESNPPMWLKVLHAIYYGRIYIWNSFGEDWIKALHFDWKHNRMSWSEPIDISGILFTDTDCKLRDFPGVFHIARFYDRAFWKESEPQKPKGETWKERAKKGREEWEQATKGHAQGQSNSRNTEEDILEAFRRAFREHMRSHGVDYNEPYIKRPNAPVGDKWLQQFINTGSLAAAKTMYRQLSKEWHPDLNPGKPQALETMQAINIAYDKVKDILR